MERIRLPEQVIVPLTYEGTRLEETGEGVMFLTQDMHGQEIVKARVRLLPEPLPVHGNANHSHWICGRTTDQNRRYGCWLPLPEAAGPGRALEG